MACETFDLLERINRLSEIALEFHGEYLGDVAAFDVVETSQALQDALFEEEEEVVTEEI
jgi:hypothetical protein